MAQTKDATRTPRLKGLGLVLLGGALVLLSFAKLTWYAADNGADSAGDSGFTELHRNVDALGGVPIASAYFDWLSWTLLIVLVLVAVAANLPSPAADGLRVLGFLVGLAGTAGTFYAMDQLFHAQSAAGATSTVWHNSTFGLWAALVGYLIAGVGAAFGPRTTRDRSNKSTARSRRSTA